MNFKTNIAGNKILLRFVSCSHSNTSCASFPSCGAFAHFLNLAIYPLLSFRILSLSHSVFIPLTGSYFCLPPSFLVIRKQITLFLCVSECVCAHMCMCVLIEDLTIDQASLETITLLFQPPDFMCYMTWYHTWNLLFVLLSLAFSLSDLVFYSFPVNIDLLNNFSLLKSNI